MIVGVLLAAGTGSRFEESTAIENQNKLLADLDGQPVVAHAARTLTESASLDALVAVVGHDRERVAEVLPDEIRVVTNPDYEQGQSTSVRRGIEAARKMVAEDARERDAEAVLFALGDLPRVRVETVEAIVRTYRKSGNAESDHDPGIVAPRFEGQRGNPVLFDSGYFDDLASVAGDRGGRALLESEDVAWVEVSDPGVHRDVDTEADLRALQEDSSSTADRG